MTVGERRRLNREREDRDIEMMRQRHAERARVASVPPLDSQARTITT